MYVYVYIYIILILFLYILTCFYILYAIRPFLIGWGSGTLNKIETPIYTYIYIYICMGVSILLVSIVSLIKGGARVFFASYRNNTGSKKVPRSMPRRPF